MLKAHLNGKSRLLIPKAVILVMAAFIGNTSGYFFCADQNNKAKNQQPVAQNQPPKSSESASSAAKTGRKSATLKPEGSGQKRGAQNNQSSVKNQKSETSATSPTETNNKTAELKEDIKMSGDKQNENIDTADKTNKKDRTADLEASRLKISELLKSELKCTAGEARCNKAQILNAVLENLNNIHEDTRAKFKNNCFGEIKEPKKVSVIPLECEKGATEIVIEGFTNHVNNPKKTETKSGADEGGGEIGSGDGAGEGIKEAPELKIKNSNKYDPYIYSAFGISMLLALTYLTLLWFDVIDWRFRRLGKQTQTGVLMLPALTFDNQTSDAEMGKVLARSGKNYETKTENKNSLTVKDALERESSLIADQQNEINRLQKQLAEAIEEKTRKELPPQTIISEKTSQSSTGFFPSLVSNILNDMRIEESLAQYPFIKQALKKPSSDSEAPVFSLIKDVSAGRAKYYVIPSFTRIGREMEFSPYKEFFTTDAHYYSGEIEVIEPAKVAWDETIKGWRLESPGKLRFV